MVMGKIIINRDKGRAGQDQRKEINIKFPKLNTKQLTHE